MYYLPKPGESTSHGYPILDVIYGPKADDLSIPDEGALICVRPGNTSEPFVVWRFSVNNGSTYSGGYHQDLLSARCDFERIQF